MNPSFLKNKKFWLLFFLVFLILAPEIAHGWGFFEVCSWQEWLTFPARTFLCALQWLFPAFLKVLIFTMIALWGALLAVATTLLALSIAILSASLVPLMSVPILNAPVVVDLWGFVRDFANLFFILFFVLIGLSTILKIENYKFQKTLPPLIIVALLVNFSLVFVGLVVDMGNILTSIFLDSVAGGAAGFNALLQLGSGALEIAMQEVWNASWASPFYVLTAGAGGIAYILSVFGLYLMAAVIFWIIIFIFLFRIAILWILAILSPLAFVSYIFDVTKKTIWQRWLTALIKWSIVSVPILFFMFIAFHVLHSAPAGIQQIIPRTTPGDAAGNISNLISAALIPIISIIIMLVGVVISMTALPEAAQSAIDAGKKSGAWVINAAKTGGRKIPGFSKAESSIMKRLESWGAAPLGSYDQRVKKEKEEAGKKIDQMGKEDLVRALNKFTRTAPEIAKILEKLAEKGNLDPETYKEYANLAEAGGADKNILLSSLPLEAEKPSDRAKAMGSITETDDFLKLHHSTFDASVSDPTQQAQQQELATRMVTMKPEQIRKFSKKVSDEMKNAAFQYIDNNETAIRAQLGKQGITGSNQDNAIKRARVNLGS